MSEKPCIDCTLPLLGICQGETGFQDHYGFDGKIVRRDVPDPAHKDKCCDCYDEAHGKPAEKRSRPRPVV